jgi:CheY-like chemotaxis protein
VAFEQGSPSVTRQFGGLGLGLAISKAIIDLHGGSIEAHSDGHGKGARLTVRLPTMAAIEQLVDRLQPPQTPRDARGLRVLLVEDHADTARILERYLTSVGYQVSTAGSVAAALTLASQHQFDIVVSDIGLPDATGLDLMRQLRQRCAVPGIAISGFGMDSDLRASQAAGFDVHLIKPVDPGRLHETIHQVVEQAAGTQG